MKTLAKLAVLTLAALNPLGLVGMAVSVALKLAKVESKVTGGRWFQGGECLMAEGILWTCGRENGNAVIDWLCS